jgi:hypothetical protein
VYTCWGFWRELDWPSPKFQFHEVGELVEVSVNWTVSGAGPVEAAFVKLATGAPDVTVIVVD